MTEPGVSPTAIEVAADALQQLALREHDDDDHVAWSTYAAEAIRALVDSGELVTRADFDSVHDAFGETEAEVTQLRALLNMDPLQANRALREEIILLEARYEMDWKDNDAEIQRLAAEVTHWKAKRDEAVSLYAARGEYLTEARAEVTRLKMVAGATPLEAFEVEHLLAEVERLSQANTAATAHAAEEADELDRLHAKNERLSQALRDLLSVPTAPLIEELEMISAVRDRARAVLGEFIQEGEPVPPNMVSVEVPRTGRPNDRYWVRREPPAQEGEGP